MLKLRIPHLHAGAGPPVDGPPPIAGSALAHHALIEFGLTSALLFVIVSTVRWVVGDPSIADGIGSLHAQVVVIAAVASATVLAIILSPGGRRTGAHVNPAITLALWRMRAFPARAVVPYVVAQLAGSLAGTGAARLAWGEAVTRAPVRDAAVAPGPGWQAWEVGLAEGGCLIVVTLIVGFFLAHPTDRIRRALPYALATVTFVFAAALGTVSGAAVNPARQLGPAVWSGQSAFLAAYLLAPLVGALIGASIHLRLVSQPVRTYKLSG